MNLLLFAIIKLFGLLRPKKIYGSKQTTDSGVVVRSKAEKEIADFLTLNSMRWEYERPLKSGFWIFKEKICSPDFYLSDYGIYIEYWGLLDADDRKTRDDYARSMNYKLAKYAQLGVPFISLYPSDLRDLAQAFRDKIAQAIGQ